jgi:anti-sigma B factor antagonist
MAAASPHAGPGDPAPPFAVDRDERGGTTVLALRGELDLHSAGVLLAATTDTPPGSRLVLDLSRLVFVDSAGLRALMNLDLRGRAEGFELALAAPGPAVLRVLRLTGFEQRLPIEDAVR